ncbi:hypothetical protein [Bacillus sp. WP8]|uniref:hypothetical protein n=1 Tax=Bacillus sp. WP8 TaxID=756828 RepID=UPI0016431C2B|nr:hypothetical protein [Bacillus sp. WP8]
MKTIEEMEEGGKGIEEVGGKYVVMSGGGKVREDKAMDLVYDGERLEGVEKDKMDRE